MPSSGRAGGALARCAAAWALVFAVVGMAPGCGSGGAAADGGPPADDARFTGDAPPADDAPAAADVGSDEWGYQPNRVGVIEIIERNSFAAVRALLLDRADVPAPALLAQDGDCAIYVHPPSALCTPPCSEAVCVATDTCEPWPVVVPAGVITVAGLKVPLIFQVAASGYTAQPEPRVGDLFDPGAAIAASAPGGAGEGFTVAATGVTPLVADLPSTLELVDGVDLEITWIAAHEGRIQLALVFGGHGRPYDALLLCETSDDGALTIPGGLIAQLPRGSSWPEYTSWIARFSRGVATTGAGPVELFVASQLMIRMLSHQ